MAFANPTLSRRPRELRRRVVLPARLRLGEIWGDACILNISSRGLLIQAPRGAEQGSLVELRRGEHAILARVIWRLGARAGLRAEECLPVDDILAMGQAPSLQLTSVSGRLIIKRRTHDGSRLRGRAIEFAGIVFVAALLAVAGFIMVEQALAKPLALVGAALGG